MPAHGWAGWPKLWAAAAREGKGRVHPAVTAPAAILRLNTELLLNCLEGVDDGAANRAPAEGTNSIAFLTTHLIDSRHFLTAELGAPLENPLAGLLVGAKGIADVASLPPLDELRTHWNRVAAHLAIVVERLDTPALAAPGRRFPGSDGTALGMLSFLAQHESYHLGQVALLRRQLGFPAMHYRLAPREPGRQGA